MAGVNTLAEIGGLVLVRRRRRSVERLAAA
jgi:hypothetical protein